MADTMMAVDSATVEQKLVSSGQLMIERANNMTVNSQDDYEQAAKALVEIKTRTKQIKDYWQKPKADAAAAHKTICDKEKEMLKPLNEAESIIKRTMVAYQNAVEKARIEAEEAAKKRKQEETDRLLAQAIKAQEEGNDHDAEINMAMAQMIDDMNPVQSILRPKAAGTSIRKTWKARVINEKAVPAYVNGIEVRKISITALNDLAKMTNGTLEIPGVEFYQESTLSVKT